MALKGVNLPLFDVPYYSYSASLEGNSYVFKFIFNERSQLYYLSLFDSDREPVFLSVAVVPGYPIGIDYALTNLSGFFWLEQKGELQSEPYKLFPDKLSEYYTLSYSYIDGD